MRLEFDQDRHQDLCMVGQAMDCTSLGRASHSIDIIDLNIYYDSFSERWHAKCLKKEALFPQLHKINFMAS